MHRILTDHPKIAETFNYSFNAKGALGTNGLMNILAML